MTLPRCETCRFWERPDEDEQPHGVCGKANNGEQEFYVYPGDGYLWTKADFGCVMHEAKHDVELVNGVPTAARDIEPGEDITMPIEAYAKILQDEHDRPGKCLTCGADIPPRSIDCPSGARLADVTTQSSEGREFVHCEERE